MATPRKTKTTKQISLKELLASLETMSLGGGSNRPEDVAFRNSIRTRPLPEVDAVAMAIENMPTGSIAGLLLTRLAQDEAQDLKAARIAEKPIPAHPFLEALTRRNALMTSTKATTTATTSSGGGGGTRSSKASGVTFTHDGKPVSATQNKLSSVAWFYTNGLAAGGGRLKVGELKALLKREGVEDPHKPGWSVKLANGITIGCVAAGATIPEVPKDPKQPKLATAAKTPRASKSTAKKPAAKTASVTSIDKARSLRSSGPNATKTPAAKKPAAKKQPAKKRGQGSTAAPSKLAPDNRRKATTKA